MQSLLLAALASVALGCSIVVDSDQYLEPRTPGADGGADGGTDGGPGADGGQDAGSGDCMSNRDCRISEMCELETGNCVPRLCARECADGEYCDGTECQACDGDADGFYADARACDSLRGEARPDCDDADDTRYPGASVICGNGMLDGCPDPLAAPLLEALGGAELGSGPRFELIREARDSLHGPVQLVNAPVTSSDSLPHDGMVMYGLGAPEPVTHFYDFGGPGAYALLADGLTQPPLVGPRARWAARFLNGVPLVAVTVSDGSAMQMALYWQTPEGTYSRIATGAPVQSLPSDFLVIRRNAADPTEPDVAWTEAPVDAPSVLSNLTGSIAIETLAGGPGAWLSGDGTLILAPSTLENEVIVSDVNGAIPEHGVALGGGTVHGRPDAAFLPSRDMPVFLSVIPTAAGIVVVPTQCGVAGCVSTPHAPFGSVEPAIVSVDYLAALGERTEARSVAVALSRPDAGGGDGDEVALMLATAPDGFLPAGSPVAVPFLTQAQLGAPFVVLDLDFGGRLLRDEEGGPVGGRLELAALLALPGTPEAMVYLASLDLCFRE